MNRHHNAVLLVDHNAARARRAATILGCERWVVTVANSIADALVFIAIHPPDLVIVALGENGDPRTSASALRAVVRDLRILFTGHVDPHRADAIDALDAGEHYLPMLSHARLRILLHRSPGGSVGPTMRLANLRIA